MIKEPYLGIRWGSLFQVLGILDPLVLLVRSAGNEKWNDPKKNQPLWCFLRESLGSLSTPRRSLPTQHQHFLDPVYWHAAHKPCHKKGTHFDNPIAQSTGSKLLVCRKSIFGQVPKGDSLPFPGPKRAEFSPRKRGR